MDANAGRTPSLVCHETLNEIQKQKWLRVEGYSGMMSHGGLEHVHMPNVLPMRDALSPFA